MKFFYVYILQSEMAEETFYVGFTEDLKARLKLHNAGQVFHTAKFRPWKVKTTVAFSDRQRAVEFERYLKSASGRAFARQTASLLPRQSMACRTVSSSRTCAASCGWQAILPLTIAPKRGKRIRVKSKTTIWCRCAAAGLPVGVFFVAGCGKQDAELGCSAAKGAGSRARV